MMTSLDESDDRTQLLSSTQRLQMSTSRLQEARQIAIDTEAIAAATLVELQDQRDQLHRIRGQVQRVDVELSRSRRVLNAIMRRAQTNKCVLYAIMFFAVAIIILILVLKLT